MRWRLAVEAAERRALVARDHRAGVQSTAAVGAVLVERQPDEPLEARDQHAALVEDVLVVGEISRRMPSSRPQHGGSARRRWRSCDRPGRAGVRRLTSSGSPFPPTRTYGQANLPFTVHGSQRRDRLKEWGVGYMVKHHDHCYPAAPQAEHRPRRRRPRADRRAPGSGDRPADSGCGRPLDGARPRARRDAAQATRAGCARHSA